MTRGLAASVRAGLSRRRGLEGLDEVNLVIDEHRRIAGAHLRSEDMHQVEHLERSPSVDDRTILERLLGRVVPRIREAVEVLEKLFQACGGKSYPHEIAGSDNNVHFQLLVDPTARTVLIKCYIIKE
jgi:hypothetical protein